MSTPQSYAFQRFYDSFFGDPYMAWHDGLDEGAILELQGAERDEAIQMLQAGLATGDPRMAQGLGLLGVPEAVEPLRARLAGADDLERLRAAQALWRITADPAAAAVLIDVLRRTDHWGTRLDAALALRELPPALAIPPLAVALKDHDALVRFHSVQALLHLSGMADDDPQYEPLGIAMMSEDATERNTTRRAILARLPPQESPDGKNAA